MAAFKADILGMKISFTSEILHSALLGTLCTASSAAGTPPCQLTGNSALQNPLKDATSFSP